jgi:hypothetical protein
MIYHDEAELMADAHVDGHHAGTPREGCPTCEDRPLASYPVRPVAYVTEDGATVHTGDKVYNYYDMEPGTIGRPAGQDGWFYFHADGKGTNILNGPRICTMAFAKRRGFRGA